jgi:hypothetical protein
MITVSQTGRSEATKIWPIAANLLVAFLGCLLVLGLIVVGVMSGDRGLIRRLNGIWAPQPNGLQV